MVTYMYLCMYACMYVGDESDVSAARQQEPQVVISGPVSDVIAAEQSRRWNNIYTYIHA